MDVCCATHLCSKVCMVLHVHMLMKFTTSYNNNTVELGEGNETKMKWAKLY
jgi:hypothetical protein